MSEQVNRPGYVFHCEFPRCRETRALKLVRVTVRLDVGRYFWRCEAHR